jgi:probable phosphoglycerate mutase
MEARPKDIDGCPGGETLAEVSARADRAIARIRALEGDVLVFAHRDIFPLLAARWIALPALEARRLYLETAPLRIPGYDRGLDKPVIRRLNDARHSSRLPSSPKGKMTSEQT